MSNGRRGKIVHLVLSVLCVRKWLNGSGRNVSVTARSPARLGANDRPNTPNTARLECLSERTACVYAASLNISGL